MQSLVVQFHLHVKMGSIKIMLLQLTVVYLSYTFMKDDEFLLTLTPIIVWRMKLCKL